MIRLGRFAGIALGAALCLPAAVSATETSEKLHTLARGSVEGVERSRLDYDLGAVRSGEAAAPAVFAKTLPEGLSEIRETAKKKRTFIRLVLPLVLESNNRILAQRAELERLMAKEAIFRKDRQWLVELALAYDLDPDKPDLMERLLLRVDVIPPSLAIAQSITESGWGTSRFARKGRALFGQRTWSRGGGIVPTERREGETYEVKSFRNLMESVTGYMRNLNTHNAYRELRQARAEMRAAGELIDGYRLAEGLHRYAETGQRYVEDVQGLIRFNRLRDFDDAELQVTSDRVAALR